MRTRFAYHLVGPYHTGRMSRCELGSHNHHCIFPIWQLVKCELGSYFIVRVFYTGYIDNVRTRFAYGVYCSGMFKVWLYTRLSANSVRVLKWSFNANLVRNLWILAVLLDITFNFHTCSYYLIYFLLFYVLTYFIFFFTIYYIDIYLRSWKGGTLNGCGDCCN